MERGRKGDGLGRKWGEGGTVTKGVWESQTDRQSGRQPERGREMMRDNIQMDRNVMSTSKE